MIEVDKQMKGKLGDVAEIIMGQSPDSSSYNEDERGFAFLQGCSDFGPRNPDTKIFCDQPTKVVQKDTILISVRAPVGEINKADKKYCIGRGLAGVVGKNIDQSYLLYWLDFGKAQLQQVSQGTTFEAINSSDLKNYQILVLPLKVQQKIGTILYTVDNLIEKTEYLIKKYQAIKQGMMHDLFTRGIETNGQLRPSYNDVPHLYKETEFGWIPRDWFSSRLGKVFDIQLGKMLSKASKTGFNSAFYLGNKNVQWNYVDLSELEEMDFSTSERQKYSLKYGDLLVCEGGEVGRTSMWRGEAKNVYFQKAIHRLRPCDGSVEPGYMLRFMLYAANSGWLNNYSSQTSIAHLTQEKLSKVPIFFPEIKEQQEIVKRFDAIDNRLYLEKKQKDKFNSIKNGLAQDLLTGRVRVPMENDLEEVV